MTVMPEDFDLPTATATPRRQVLAPAMRLALENQGRWVLVTELGTKESAAARVSIYRKSLTAKGYSVARQDAKVFIRYDGEPAPEPEAAPELDVPEGLAE